MEGMALIALGYSMIRCERRPVLALAGGQDACSPAQRAHILKGRQYRIADKAGAIGDAFHSLGQRSICLEGDYFLLGGISHCVSSPCRSLAEQRFLNISIVFARA